MLATQALCFVRSITLKLISCDSDAYDKPTINIDVTAILRSRGI